RAARPESGAPDIRLQAIISSFAENLLVANTCKGSLIGRMGKRNLPV
ncbi:MAG: hypothetical protein ACI8X3_002404, partial [Saprospiraceae bacterium]